MEWALAILFGTATLLLILSLIKTKQATKAEQKKIDMNYLSLMEVINDLELQIRHLELDGEILAQEAGIERMSAKERLVLRESLDLYKRGYSIHSIAAKKEVSENEIKQILSPYMAAKAKKERVS